MYLIVGLGNPGSRYRNTRHNIGFRVVDLWSRELGVRLTGRRFQSRNTRTPFQQKEIILLCPVTFMNRSGKPVKAFADYYAVEVKDIVVIHDDLDLALGRVKVVRDAGAGGHKGVQSIIEHLGSKAFGRIKIGIGRPRPGESVEDYVLSPFYPHEKDMTQRVTHLAVCACKLVVSEGVGSAMNQINSQNLAEKEGRS